MPWGVAAAVAGAAITSAGAQGAADTQAEAAAESSAVQERANAQMREDLAPWVDSGRNANSLLSQYLGTGGVGSSGVTSMGLATGLSPDQVRQQLLSRYTTQRTSPTANTAPQSAGLGRAGELANIVGRNAGAPSDTDNGTAGRWETITAGSGDGQQTQRVWVPGAMQESSIDENGLNAAIQQYYQEQEAQNAQVASDPKYGSLLRAYRDGEEFSFTGKDLASDPGYQFGLNQGTQGIERGQASRGNFLSGAAMKELTRFNEDYAGTKFNDAFARNQSQWNTNLGAYNQNRNTIYNFLTGQSTMGQNSAARVGTNNQQTATNVGNNILAAGNAGAASQVATGNAVASGLNSAANSYNSSNNLNSAAGWNNLLSGSGGGYSGYTGYVGQSDPIANINTQNGWT